LGLHLACSRDATCQAIAAWIKKGMLDTLRKSQATERLDRFDDHSNVRPTPAFGFGSLRNRKGLLGLSALMFLAIGLFYSWHRPKTYTASSQLLVYIKRVLTGVDLAILPGRADLPLVQNQIELLRSGNVLIKLVEELQTEAQASISSGRNAAPSSAAFSSTLEALHNGLNIRQVGTSHLITVKFTASEPERAAEIVNKLIRVYLQELARTSEAGSSKAPALRELYQSLGPSVYVISAAEPPVRADGPPAVLIAVGAALFGLAVAAAIAILLDAVNDTIRSTRQLEYALGMDCLGVMRARAGGGALADRGAEPANDSEDGELRRAASTLLTASLAGLRTIGVTSAMPGEGATTLAVGLARAMAASGSRVLVIDACSENPSVSRWARKAPRLSARPDDGRHSTTFDQLVEIRARLHVLPLAGLTDRKPLSISPAALDEVLRSVAEAYDFVIVDMSALATGPDVRAAAQSLNGFLLAVKWGATDSELIRQALQSAGDARAKFIGAVLTMANEKTMRRYGDEFLQDVEAAMAP
jgi:Mrp family chromosome partitioning ATPase